MDSPRPSPESGLVFVTRPLKKAAPQPTAVTRTAAPAPAAPRTLAEAPTPPPRPTARLVVVRGERPDATFALLDGKNLIGRTADYAVDIDLDGQETPERTWTSRRHAVVAVETGAVTVEDLNSLNGTFINRGRLPPGVRKPLKPGDVVQIGTVQLKLVVS